MPSASETMAAAVNPGVRRIVRSAYRAGWREPLQLLAAVVTIVSGSVVYYVFGLHKVAQRMVATAGSAPRR